MFSASQIDQHRTGITINFPYPVEGETWTLRFWDTTTTDYTFADTSSDVFDDNMELILSSITSNGGGYVDGYIGNIEIEKEFYLFAPDGTPEVAPFYIKSISINNVVCTNWVVVPSEDYQSVRFFLMVPANQDVDCYQLITQWGFEPLVYTAEAPPD